MIHYPLILLQGFHVFGLEFWGSDVQFANDQAIRTQTVKSLYFNFLDKHKSLVLQ